MEIKELYHYMINGTEEQNDQAIDVLSEIMYELQKKYPSYYAKYDRRLEEIYRHGYMSEEEAHEYVAAMKNKDGSVGEHWTLAQVQSYIDSHPDFAGIDPVCFYVAINMMYSDYYKPGRTTDTYAMLAKDFLTDKDGKPDKLQRYIKAMSED